MKYTLHGLRQKSNEIFDLVGLEISFDRFDGAGQLRKEFEILRKRDAVAVLVEVLESKELVLVKQFRPALIDKADPWLTEVVAGGIDDGETAEEAARRECWEETGFRPNELMKIGSFFPTPGITDECIHCFLAKASEKDSTPGQSGLLGEHEDIQLIRLQPNDVRDYLTQCTDAKTMICLQWYLSHQL